MDLEHPLTPPDNDDEHLPCGADLDELQTHAVVPPGHEDCPHCRDAIAALRTLDTLIRQAIETEPADQDIATPLTERIMRAVRTELRPGPLVPMGEASEDLWITHAAAARALRRAVDALPGIRAGRCRITPVGEVARPRSGRLPRGPVDIWLEIAVSPEHGIAQAAATVRRAVTDTAADQFGFAVREIDLAVIDLLTPGPASYSAERHRSDH